ncbi:ABC transporter substrate-binding protein [Anabaena cylindrica FACHB-243]|uniref:ABC transporter, periplasmic binding protein n=2 Tax=Anabaena TaxID=1163 RepID=K9ZSQ6_ANACC|nr:MULTISPECIES: hypothetical protein [Anabaena]AFZ61410.1 ABC transporter, periplasmic binding protein [Anabaena cylindrica PCC 7122]MBD2421827.1 ABC transporter substrate-binding protein [Anabaena cylindrica FACHB-243]MBY5281894.1 ABC transporter substrate-binding protein [Anabaena sp. CCAP 1446/1C]MBY5306956.1 ABC transporter substrate-binding protein [Anabaena sp. CCAP 1446/1C]BAY06697.1 hypothetical protein NIES19_59800 [Anabaena cylindrica PCC 7122]
MKFNPNLKPLVIFLFSLAFLPIQNPEMALLNLGESGNFHSNLGLNPTQDFTKKQPIQIARNDHYWGLQRDF